MVKEQKGFETEPQSPWLNMYIQATKKSYIMSSHILSLSCRKSYICCKVFILCEGATWLDPVYHQPPRDPNTDVQAAKVSFPCLFNKIFPEERISLHPEKTFNRLKSVFNKKPKPFPLLGKGNAIPPMDLRVFGRDSPYTHHFRGKNWAGWSNFPRSLDPLWLFNRPPLQIHTGFSCFFS